VKYPLIPIGLVGINYPHFVIVARMGVCRDVWLMV